MNWSREHDALIARVAEGKTVYTWDDLMPVYANTEEPSWPNREGCELHRKRIPDELFHMKHPSCTIGHYFADLHAIARAGETWRTKDDDIDRTMQVYSAVERMDLRFRAEFCENYRDGENYEWRTFKGEGDTEVEARAWALWRACGGVE